MFCYNEPLALRIGASIEAKGLRDRVHVRHFHPWCREQLVTFGHQLPASSLPEGAYAKDLVDRVIRAVERWQVLSGQYLAVPVDKGQDLEPEWLELVIQGVDPATNDLLLYDDAHRIHWRTRKRLDFSLKSVGIIDAMGRCSTNLRFNYHDTRQILQAASRLAAKLLSNDGGQQSQGNDEVPRPHPIGCGREGPKPLPIRLPTVREQAVRITEPMCAAHEEGQAWGEMATLCRDGNVMEEGTGVLKRRCLRHQARRRASRFDPAADTIKVMTIHVSKGLEFSAVGSLGADGAADEPEARLLCVAATRATERLIVATGKGAGHPLSVVG